MKLKESREDLVSFGQDGSVEKIARTAARYASQGHLGCLSDLSTRISRSHSWVVFRHWSGGQD
jgi:hypothetical protein